MRVLKFLCKRQYTASGVVRARQEFHPVIGLEVHVQLKSRSKLFSRAPCAEDGGPNSRVAPLDMACPGTLPILNKQCVMQALRMAVLFSCEVPPVCRFDRKHYFYADMPAGYQITQSESPIARNGIFRSFVYGEDFPTYSKEISISQLQLEQDSGKTIYHENEALIDLNRAGAPLVEVVTTPCFSSAVEAVCFVQQLRLLLIHHRISEGEMHKGHMRIDANISLSQGSTMGVKTEVKNINSMRHLHTAINFEINRQYNILSTDGTVVNETRACDAQGRTVPMRDKEEETDYRIMAEPNLPSVKIRPEWLTECIKSIDSQPKYQQYILFGFDPRTSIYYAEDDLLSRFVDLCLVHFDIISTDEFTSWLKELKTLMQRSKMVFPPQSKFFAEHFMSVISYYFKGKITRLRAIETLKAYINEVETRSADQVFNDGDLWRITDESTISILLNDIIKKNDKLVDKAIKGHMKSVSRLRNMLVESSEKRVDVEMAERVVMDRLRNLK